MAKKPAQTSPSNAFDHDREHMHRQLFSAVSHDLKTPLASIIGSLEIHQRMRDKLPPEKKEILIATALQEAYRLDSFVTNILDMSKLESDMVKLRIEKFNVGMMIKDCLVNLDNRLKGSKVEIEAPDGEVTAESDSSLMCRALSLVLDNAVKYGGTPSVITITYGRDAMDKIYISIHDNGKGIPENQLEGIFEKYTRFTKSDQQNAGTGLGLAICRQVMRVLGGSIHASNDWQKSGAIFTIKIP